MIRLTIWHCLHHDRPHEGCQQCARPPGQLHPPCQRCGWRMGGVDSWNGRACKCGRSAAPYPNFALQEALEWLPHIEAGIIEVLARRAAR